MATLLHPFPLNICPQNQIQCNKLMKHKNWLANHTETISLFIQLQHQCNFNADNYSFPILFNSASNLSSISVASALHAHAIITGYHLHPFVQTSLINLYSALGLVGNARKVFDEMLHRDVVAWNSMLDAYAGRCMGEECAELFAAMPRKDRVSFNIMVDFYARTERVDEAEALFDMAPDRDSFTWNSMLLMYVKAGRIDFAREFFERIREKDVASWNIVLDGYLQSKLYEEVLDLFSEMRAARELEPNYVILVTVLSACANLGHLKMGREIHNLALELGLFSNSHVANALIDMYCKCGAVTEALLVFHKTLSKDIYCWNSMISGLALQGYGKASLRLFEDMKSKGQKPDDITFIGLLTACSHSGFVAEGLNFFHSMESRFQLYPKSEHYGCVVSLLGRAGLIDDAYQIVKGMRFKPGISILGALLSSCVVHRNVDVGDEIATEIIGRGDKMEDGEYIMLANFYAMCGRLDEAAKWRGMMKKRGVAKEAGCSRIMIGDEMHEFVAGE